MSISLSKIKDKLEILADAAKYDASCSSSGGNRKRLNSGMGNSEGTGICHSYSPDGRCISLLKILLTNYCVYDCKYCVNRISSDVKRARFSPEEVVSLTLEFYRRNYIEGLFLSSGIIQSSDYTMEQLVKVAKILRVEHKFNGYIHLKMVAGASKELVEKAGLWADRVSANIELPTQTDLDVLAPGKTIDSVTDVMGQVEQKNKEYKEDRKKFKSTPKFAPAGQSTQLIVGATKSSDATILKTSEKLYSDYSLRRVYYSAYTPISHPYGDLLVNKPPLLREHRLYQADWLLRFYGFKADELVADETTNLDLELDPKTMWALSNRDFFPVDVNKASKAMLLRVPGFGARSVQKILELRKFKKVYFDDLVKIRTPLSKAQYFIELADTNLNLRFLDQTQLESHLRPKSQQLSLFEVS